MNSLLLLSYVYVYVLRCNFVCLFGVGAAWVRVGMTACVLEWRSECWNDWMSVEMTEWVLEWLNEGGNDWVRVGMTEWGWECLSECGNDWVLECWNDWVNMGVKDVFRRNVFCEIKTTTKNKIKSLKTCLFVDPHISRLCPTGRQAYKPITSELESFQAAAN